MDGLGLLERARAAGLRVTVEEDTLVIRGPRTADALARELLAHKPEIMPLLSTRSCPRTVNTAPLWHAEEVARRVEAEGVCIFWSDLFGELVAFVKGASYKRRVPKDIVTYTCAELAELDRAAPLDAALLRRVHEAKNWITEVDSGQG